MSLSTCACVWTHFHASVHEEGADLMHCNSKAPWPQGEQEPMGWLWVAVPFSQWGAPGSLSELSLTAHSQCWRWTWFIKSYISIRPRSSASPVTVLLLCHLDWWSMGGHLCRDELGLGVSLVVLTCVSTRWCVCTCVHPCLIWDMLVLSFWSISISLSALEFPLCLQQRVYVYVRPTVCPLCVCVCVCLTHSLWQHSIWHWLVTIYSPWPVVCRDDWQVWISLLKPLALSQIYPAGEYQQLIVENTHTHTHTHQILPVCNPQSTGQRFLKQSKVQWDPSIK